MLPQQRTGFHKKGYSSVLVMLRNILLAQYPFLFLLYMIWDHGNRHKCGPKATNRACLTNEGLISVSLITFYSVIYVEQQFSRWELHAKS